MKDSAWSGIGEGNDRNYALEEAMWEKEKDYMKKKEEAMKKMSPTEKLGQWYDDFWLK